MRRIGWISFAVLVALGLLWSAAATSKLVPMPSAEISTASMAPGWRWPDHRHCNRRQQWHCDVP